MKLKKKALITGITGQDGAYLSELLLNKGYEVIGTSRKIVSNYNWRLKHLKINKDVKILKIDSSDENKIKNIIKNESLDEIYNLSGISSVSDSFKNPIKTFKANTINCLQILNSIYEVNKKPMFSDLSDSSNFLFLKLTVSAVLFTIFTSTSVAPFFLALEIQRSTISLSLLLYSSIC